MTLIEDWTSYVEKPDVFDRSHFESLMLELDTEVAIRKILDQLPNGQAFLKGVIHVRKHTISNGTYLIGSSRKVTDTDHRLAKNYRDRVFGFLKDINDPDAKKLLDSPIVEITK